MPPQSGFSFGASGSPLSNATPQPGVQPMDGWAALAQLLSGTHQQQASPQFDIGSMLQQLHQVRDPQGYANRSYVPGQQNSGNPFDNGFFKTMDQRRQIEQDRLGTPGFSSLSPQQQATALRSNQPQDSIAGAAGASPLPFQLSPETLALIHGMPNPPTTAMNMFGFPSRSLPPAAPPLGGVPAGPQGRGTQRPLGSPTASPFSFGF